MEHRSLQTLFLRIGRNINPLFCGRVDPRIKHTGRQRSRSRIKILNLIGNKSVLLKEDRQLAGIFQSCAGMRRKEIRNHILFFAYAFIFRLVFSAESLKDAAVRLMHPLQHVIRNVFRRHLQRTADMMFAQFPQKTAALLR